MENLDKLVYWIKERENVRLLKEKGVGKPWSTDPVFHETYFCNVHREDDKVTKWIREHWSPSPDHFGGAYELAMCAARLINKPTTLDLIGYPNDTEHGQDLWIGNAIDIMRSLAEQGVTIWGNAYVVTTHGRKMDKLTYLEEVLRAIAESDLHHFMYKPREDPLTLALAHYKIQQYEGFGSFMAAQVVADLKNTKFHPLSQARDWWWWSAPGPGSLRGLAWVYGKPKVSERDYPPMMDALLEEVLPRIDPIEVCAQDLQNCLCEFDKYMRVKYNTGRSKRKYNGI